MHDWIARCIPDTQCFSYEAAVSDHRDPSGCRWDRSWVLGWAWERRLRELCELVSKFSLWPLSLCFWDFCLWAHTKHCDLVKKKLLWCQASYWNLVFMDSCCFIVKSEFYLAFKTLCNLTPALLFILISCLFSSPEVSAMLNHLFPLTMLSLISESSPIPSLFEIWSFHHYLFVVAFSVPPRSTFWVK